MPYNICSMCGKDAKNICSVCSNEICEECTVVSKKPGSCDNLCPYCSEEEPEYENKSFMGIDLSLSGTGLAVLSDNKKYCRTFCTERKDYVSDYKRIDAVLEYVLTRLAEVKPVLACIEEPIINPKNIRGNKQLIGLGIIVRRDIEYAGYSFFDVKIQHLKQYATGKGNAQKTQIINAMQNEGWPVYDDNQADAGTLAMMAQAIYARQNGFKDTFRFPWQEAPLQKTVGNNWKEKAI